VVVPERSQVLLLTNEGGIRVFSHNAARNTFHHRVQSRLVSYDLNGLYESALRSMSNSVQYLLSLRQVTILPCHRRVRIVVARTR
jgi:hypothetical protein